MRPGWAAKPWADHARRFLADTTMRQPEHDQFLLKRRWLQSLVGTYTAVSTDPVGEVQLGPPHVVVYGSSVAGTAFQHGDVDFAVVFPRKVADSERSSTVATDASLQIDASHLSTVGDFAVIDREAQPQVLSSLHDHIRARHPDMRFQRIFRARIPIMQFVPQLSELQNLNAAIGQSSAEPSEAAAPAENSAGPDGLVARWSQAESLIVQRAKRILQVREVSTDASVPRSSKKEHFDVSLSLDGCRNSLLLREYMVNFPHLRAATMALKHWGRRVRILNARRGWLSPYSLTVMLIHYAHAAGVVPALIPPSQADVKLQDVAAALQKQDAADADTADPIASIDCLSKTLPPFESDVGLSDVATILEGFFSYYSSTFDFDTDVVDIRTEARVATKEEWLAGELRDVTERERWHRCGYEVLMIRDPYENHSLGRSVEFFRGEAIRDEFRKALVNPPTPADFFSALGRE